MEKSAFIIVFHVGFGLWDVCSGLPIDFSTVGTGKLNALWLTSSLLLAVAFLIGIVSLIIGCICCRNGRGFQQNEAKTGEEFNNSDGCLANQVVDGFVNPTASSEITIFPPVAITSNLSSRSSIINFEPLPNIKPQSPNLRPAAFSYSEQEISSQDWFYDPYNNFPRHQLKYLQEYGKGWFGRVVEGEAQNILENEKVSKVIVKILHEDATPTDQMYFLHEVKFYRDLKHPNILSLLGRCLETEPFLILLESCPNGDLKSFLTQNMASAQALSEQGITLRMCYNITSGLQFMHKNKFIHTDLAARNCLVSPDLTVKIGDYGNSIEVFKSDYYCAGHVALPVRWCAPETLKCTDVTIETREVTPVANVWTLAVVFWEICEFCKLPYEELNDDQVIVRVLGEKNYFLKIPKMFCLYKDELYHLMKLCWSPPLQRPSASQICVILENLLSSNSVMSKQDIHPGRFSQDFEQRWEKSKPNRISKQETSNESDVAHTVPSTTKFKGAKVADSSYMDSPLGVFMMNKSKGHDPPRFCLKYDTIKNDKNDGQASDSENLDNKSGNNEAEEYFTALRRSDSVKNLTGSLDRLNTVAQELRNNEFKMNFDFDSEIKPPPVINSNFNTENPEIDSWLKGVEVNNEEDETFVRKISEAIRDLDAALALEKTSSSEENSGKSSHQNSPGKDTKESEGAVIVDFKLGGDTSSFMNFIPKSFELSSLQNSQEPPSLNFNNEISMQKPTTLEGSEFYESYQQNNFVNPLVEPKDSFRFKSSIFDESLKGHDSLLNTQSCNSSDTEDEIWRRRIERGEFSEKVKEKSKSIANLMILTHIEASDESDIDADRSFERSINRNSYSRRHSSNPKASLTSNNFGSENDVINAVLEDNFKESLKKLSNDHKEYGRFDSLGMILPTSVDRENVWGSIMKKSNSEENLSILINSVFSQNDFSTNKEDSLETDPSEVLQKSETIQKNSDNRNNFLGNTASENPEPVILDINHLKDSASPSNTDPKMVYFKEESVCNSSLSCKGRLENNEKYDVKSKDDCPELVLLGSSQKINDGASSVLASSVPSVSPGETIVDAVQYRMSDPVISEASEITHEGFNSSNDDITNIFVMEEEKNTDVCTKDLPNNSGENEVIFSNQSKFSYSPEVRLTKPRSTPHKADIISNTVTEQHRTSFNRDINSGVSDEKDYISSGQAILNIEDLNVTGLTENIPEIFVTDESSLQSFPADAETETIEMDLPKIRPFKFILRDEKDCETPKSEICDTEIDINSVNMANKTKDITEKMEVNNEKSDTSSILNVNYDKKNFSPLKKECVDILNEKYGHIQENFNNGVQVIIGACEDYALDYFKGLKTTFGNVEEKISDCVSNEKEFGNIPGMGINKDVNLYVWNKHLEKSIIQILDNTNFDDIDLFNVNGDPSEKNGYTNTKVIGSDNSLSGSPNSSLTNEETEDSVLKDKKNEDSLQSSGFTNLNENTSEEEYENNKLRTPDDERSSDSGFRDKGSLSESVEDACEGKYNLEDIEAELEEAFVKGAFNNRDVENDKEFSNASQGNNFEFEETKFYEDENKNEDDLSDVDGEIEFWQSQESSDYYPEMSEFNPVSSCGWYLHPPDENFSVPNGNINEEFVNALRDELRQILPKQSRSFQEFSEDYDGSCESLDEEKNVKYTSYSVALSPILEEQDHSLCDDIGTNIDLHCQTSKDNHTQKIKKNMVSLIEAGKSLDTNTFVHYMDYMVETEGKNLNVMDVKSVPPIIGGGAHRGSANGNNLKEFNEYDFMIESSKDKKSEDVLILNMDTNEATFLESSPLNGKSNEMVCRKGDGSEVVLDLVSPEKDRSLSEPSRSSNGSRGEDTLSEMTTSSPDNMSECFLTPTSEKSPLGSPERLNSNISSKCDETSEDFVGNVDFPIFGKLDNSKSSEFHLGIRSDYYNDSDSKFGPVIEESPSMMDHPSDLEYDIYVNKSEGAHEMSTSFMGDDDLSDDNIQCNGSNRQETASEKNVSLSEQDLEHKGNDIQLINEWDSFSSGGEDEFSSSSVEFIWKDGDKESKVKVKHVCDGTAVKGLFEDTERKLSVDSELPLENGGIEHNTKYEMRVDIGNDDNDANNINDDYDVIDSENRDSDFSDSEDGADCSSTGSSASITDFVPSAWNSQATPRRPALRSPDKKPENRKRSVWFKKQKYHCVYEYPREPSDSESSGTSPQRHFTYGIDASERANNYFTYGINNKMKSDNKYFTYRFPDLVGFPNFIEWDRADTEETTGEAETGSQLDGKSGEINDHEFYNMNSFDCSFNNAGLAQDDEFFVSSSARPFQGSSSSQFFPSSQYNAFKIEKKEDEAFEKNCQESRSIDFITPDSGLEDSTNVTPIKKTDVNDCEANLLKSNETVKNDENSLNVFENLTFNFITKPVENSVEKMIEAVGDNKCSSSENLPNACFNHSPVGLGELRHARGKLKLDLPLNHNINLDVTVGKNANKIEEVTQN